MASPFISGFGVTLGDQLCPVGDRVRIVVCAVISFGHCAGQSSSPGLGEFTDLGVGALDAVSPKGDGSPVVARCQEHQAGWGASGKSRRRAACRSCRDP